MNKRREDSGPEIDDYVDYGVLDQQTVDEGVQTLLNGTGGTSELPHGVNPQQLQNVEKDQSPAITQEDVDKLVRDLTEISKNLLWQYSEWRNKEAEYDPRFQTKNYLINDAPEILIVASLAGLYVTSKAGARLGDLVLSLFQQETDTRTRERIPLDNRQYQIFVSHSWNYDEHRDRIKQFLNDEPQLTYRDFSVPEHDPLEFEDRNDLRQQIYQRVKQSHVVVIPSGMYVAHSEWINEEIEMAKSLGKPLIGVKPWGSSQTPKVVREEADEMVGWQQRSVLNAIARHG